MPIIRFEQVSVSIHDKPLLSDISFTVLRGEKAVLCGKSGAGKSSVLKTLMGLYALQSGCVFFQEHPLTVTSLKAIRQEIAYIGQEPVLGAADVRTALLLPFQFKVHQGKRPSETKIIQVLEQLQLPASLLKQDCSNISGGEKQRIAIARAMLLDKQVYLLDEVTSALDAANKAAVFDIFADPQLTILSVAHDPEWLERCAMVIELEAGRLIQTRRTL